MINLQNANVNEVTVEPTFMLKYCKKINYELYLIRTSITHIERA